MNELLRKIKKIVVQVSTPFAIGTGFFIKGAGVVVTSEQLVRGNREVTIQNKALPMQLGRVIFLDPVYNVAFVTVSGGAVQNIPKLQEEKQALKGQQVIAAGHPADMKFVYRGGKVIDPGFKANHHRYIRHNISLSPAFIGGPLVTEEGLLLGMNTIIEQEESCAIPIGIILEDLKAFEAGGGHTGLRCLECAEILFEIDLVNGKCPNCDAEVQLFNEVDYFQPVGIAKTIEQLLEQLGYSASLARRGPNAWEIVQGSALISISYHEDSGLINGDAYLCSFDDQSKEELFAFLLSANYELEGLTFSIKNDMIVLSLLIFDQYLNLKTGSLLFEHLFEKADYYDNILVETYGAQWIEN